MSAKEKVKEKLKKAKAKKKQTSPAAIMTEEQVEDLVDQTKVEIAKEAQRSPTGRMSTTELVNKIYMFIEALAPTPFYPYQSQFAKRIIRSVIDNDGEEITALFARQSGKTETIGRVTSGLMIILPKLANMPMFAGDTRLQMYTRGFWVGIFAPISRQAQICYNRLRGFLTSKHGQAILADPDILLDFDTNNGQTVALTNGSFATAISASDGSNIEGESFMMIICEECQDIGNYKIRKSIHPMGAAYNATIVKIGTATTHKGDFYDAIQRNIIDYEKGKRRKNHFEYNYKVVEKYNPKYAKYIEGEKRKLGEDSDEFQMSYCVTPETRILTSDLKWVRADSIKKGDKLIGFDENPPKRYGQRKYKESVVEDVGVIKRPCYRLTFEDGTVVTCSSEHQWLTFTAGSRTEWTKTRDLSFTDKVYKMCDVWEDQKGDYRLGYLSAAFDGEGHLSQVGEKISQIVFSQRENPMLERVEQYLTDFGFSYGKRVGGGTNSDVSALYLTGGKYELLRFMGSVRPVRLLEKFNPNKLGTVRCCNYEDRGFYHPRLVKKEYVGLQKVLPIRTSTRTYIAEGLASHNCLKWILQRGMFLAPRQYDTLCEPKLGRIPFDKYIGHVAGIDFGKSNDSTVVTVAEVDWDNPIIVEQAKNVAETEDYVAYHVTIKDWLEIQGDDWEEQYPQIMEFLGNYRVVRVVADSTGVGAPIVSRISANMDCEVIPYTFNQSSKSVLYKHLSQEFKAKRVTIPANDDAKESFEFRRCQEQFEDLQKTYSGTIMIVAHPPERDAHDDYPDSMALAVWGAKSEGVTRPETTGNPFNRRDSIEKSYYRTRNSRTARRR